MSEHKYYILFMFMTFVSLKGQSNVEYVPMSKPADTKFLDQEMSINMKNSDIKNVLMLIGDLTGLNIVISPAVQDTITANLESVTVRTALDAILKPNGYSYFVRENIIIVKTTETEMVGELETVIIKLKYISSNGLEAPLQAVMSTRGKTQSFMPLIAGGGRGQMGSSNDANIIVVSDVQENIPQIIKMIEELDKPIPNINIAVRFIETQLDTSRGIGIDWSRQPLQIGGYSDTLSQVLPISMNNMTIATLSPTQFLSAMDIMEAEGRSKLLSSPQVTTLDNHQATTDVVTTVYIEGSMSNQNFQQGTTDNQGNVMSMLGGYNPSINMVTEKDIGIKLQVTPRINHINKITLLVDASVEALLGAAEVSTDKPRSTKRTVQTQVTVTDGDTVILGGLIAENTIENIKYVPILSNLPMVGRFFKSTSIEKEQRELLIFITPSIIG
jgi:type IV pilus assembly protein PilQ|tara:strand:- start:300 stop:1628 length:1329 start_codon:yes stop_codon:yes gene_type:complete